jgi:hypothetical protein
MKPMDSGIPVADAAEDLGVPVDALRLYVAAHKLADPSHATIATDEIAKLKEDLRARAGALRLDDLSKAALTIEWLAEAAVAGAHELNDVADRVRTIDGKVDSALSSHSEPDLSPIEKRVDDAHGRIDVIEAAAKFHKSDEEDSRINSLEAKIDASVTQSLQSAGTLQELVHAQSRELDAARAELLSLRADTTGLRSSLEATRQMATRLEEAHKQLLEGLRAAAAPSKPREVRGEAVVEEPVTRVSAPIDPKPAPEESAATAAEAEEKALPSEPNAPKFNNVPVSTPAKLGIKRAIEYNFLLERMGFRRYDSYSPDELAGEKVSVPDDDEIAKFIAKFELGCDPDEVEMVTVQRGDHQMIQYQRVKKAAGIKSWMGRPGR